MINCGNCHDQHKTSDQVRACHAASGTFADPVRAAIQEREKRVDPASPKQVSFLQSLVAERDWMSLSDQDALLHEIGEGLVPNLEDGEVSKSDASYFIGKLLDLPKAEGEQAGDPEEGIYFSDGRYFKVQVAVHGSGRKYAKIFDEATGTWEYHGRSRFNELTEETRVTPEKAAEFGHLYGMCIRCGRTLTDEDSIAAGIGPICAGKI